ncbi:MAG: PorT family protein [Prolixibacteraceae bacterium]|nr:PorT family protein [Prolixibacteraceae bacterium]
MQNNDNNIDKLFRSQLADYEVNPSPDVWDNINATLAGRRKRRRAIWLWSASAAASIALAFILGWHMSDQSFEYDTHMAELERMKIQIGNENQIQTVFEQKIELTIEKKEIASFSDFSKPTLMAESKQMNKNKEQSFPPTYLTTSNVNIDKPVLNKNLAKEQKEPTVLTEADRAVMEANIASLKGNDKKEESHNKWSVGIKASPEYRFDELLASNYEYSPAANDFSAAQNSINSTYNSNFSGGITVSYKTSKRLSFISGINYSEITQSANNVTLAFAGHNWVNNSLEAEYSTYNAKYDRQANTDKNVMISTNAGLANIKMPQGVQLAKASSLYTSMSTAAEEYNFEQTAGYIEVPLIMNYKIIDKKVGLHILGGVNTNFLVSNDVYLSQNDNTIASGNTEGLRDITFSSSLGAGLSYNITKWLNFNIEPMMKFQLNSLNDLSAYNVRPYTFGVYSGLQYMF